MPGVSANSGAGGGGGGGGGHGASMKSWLAAAVIVIGFTVGGIAIIYWNWPVFWAGVGVTVLGCIFAAAAGIMNEVTEYGGGSPSGDPQSSSS
jgi:hypothetical protein